MEAIKDVILRVYAIYNFLCCEEGFSSMLYVKNKNTSTLKGLDNILHSKHI